MRIEAAAAPKVEEVGAQRSAPQHGKAGNQNAASPPTLRPSAPPFPTVEHPGAYPTVQASGRHGSPKSARDSEPIVVRLLAQFSTPRSHTLFTLHLTGWGCPAAGMAGRITGEGQTALEHLASTAGAEMLRRRRRLPPLRPLPGGVLSTLSLSLSLSPKFVENSS